MKHLNCLLQVVSSALILGAIAITPKIAYADQSFYLSPSGADANDCLTAATACLTPNRVFARGINHDVTSAITVNADVGNYFAANFVDAGSAPTTADLHGLIDLEGFHLAGNGSIQVVCSTQQINPAGLVVGAIDAGNLGGSNPYEAWVQIAIDGGMGDYANDAGYCYVDGGACVMLANTLVGTYIQFTVGNGTITAPILSNTTGAGAVTISYATYATGGSLPTAPDASSKFNLFAPASHFKPWPVDGGASTAYSLANLYSAGNTTQAGPLLGIPSTTRGLAPSAQIQFLYCDLADAPQSASSDNAVVDNLQSGGFLDLRYTNIKGTANAVGVKNYAGTVAIEASYTNTPKGSYTSVGPYATGVLTGDNLTASAATFNTLAQRYGALQVVNDVITPAVGTTAVYGDRSNISLIDTFIDGNNTTLPVIQTLLTTNLIVNGLTAVWDGGSGMGAISCGSGGSNSLVAFQLSDAGAKLISLDNGVTYSTVTAESTQDGGSAGVHAVYDPGSGCGYTSY